LLGMAPTARAARNALHTEMMHLRKIIQRLRELSSEVTIAAGNYEKAEEVSLGWFADRAEVIKLTWREHWIWGVHPIGLSSRMKRRVRSTPTLHHLSPALSLWFKGLPMDRWIFQTPKEFRATL